MTSKISRDFLCLLLTSVALTASGAAAAPAPGERCATRLSATLLGQSASATLLASASPQISVDALLADPLFIDRFARFINATFNSVPGTIPAEDASYYLTKYILANNRPWQELFLGQYRVDAGASPSADAVVVADPSGLGYFRSPAWMQRYAGNELSGYRIVAGYRMINNVLGVKLKAALDTTGVNAEGRKAPACAGCHYNVTFGLDLAAKVLSKRVGKPPNATFSPPTEGPQTLLDGQVIRGDQELVTAMVNSIDFRYRACRLAFLFLYGRAEFSSEAATFNGCLVAFQTTGTIQAALASVAKDPAFCQ